MNAILALILLPAWSAAQFQVPPVHRAGLAEQTERLAREYQGADRDGVIRFYLERNILWAKRVGLEVDSGEVDLVGEIIQSRTLHELSDLWARRDPPANRRLGELVEMNAAFIEARWMAEKKPESWFVATIADNEALLAAAKKLSGGQFNSDGTRVIMPDAQARAAMARAFEACTRDELPERIGPVLTGQLFGFIDRRLTQEQKDALGMKLVHGHVTVVFYELEKLRDLVRQNRREFPRNYPGGRR